MLYFRQPCYLFAFSALIGFTVQGIVSNAGALHLVFPDLPFPIPFINGRTFHATISLYWTFIGLLGGIFYFFRDALSERQDIIAANVAYWIMSLVLIALEGSLVLGFPVGREYLEGPWILRAMLVGPILLMVLILIRLYTNQVKQSPKKLSLITIILGMVLALLVYVAALVYYKYPLLDALPQFLFLHVVGEAGIELISIVLITLLVTEMAAVDQSTADLIICAGLVLAGLVVTFALLQYCFLQGSFLALAATAAAFSGLHIIPVLILLYMIMELGNMKNLLQAGRRKLLVLALLACSLFYHIWAAGAMGFFLAYPGVNRYIHNTYIASSHSHQALFGVFGTLALALSFHMLYEKLEFSQKAFRWAMIAVGMLNAGILTMGFMLIAAGSLQTYFLNVIGIDMTSADALIRPYLFARIAGGGIYASGNLLFAYILFRGLWTQRDILIGKATGKQNILPSILEAYTELLAKQKVAERLLQKISLLYKMISAIGKQKLPK